MDVAGRENKFSAVVDAAQKGEPQHVTKRGIDAVVVLSAAEYARLSKLAPKPHKTFKEHLMDFPKLPEGMEDIFDDRDRCLSMPREIDFD